jgi:hypothetical protein
VGPYIVTEVIPEGLINYKTRRQGKMRATRGMQNNFDDFMRRRSMAIENYEL